MGTNFDKKKFNREKLKRGLFVIAGTISSGFSLHRNSSAGLAHYTFSSVDCRLLFKRVKKNACLAIKSQALWALHQKLCRRKRNQCQSEGIHININVDFNSLLSLIYCTRTCNANCTFGDFISRNGTHYQSANIQRELTHLRKQKKEIQIL